VKFRRITAASSVSLGKPAFAVADKGIAQPLRLAQSPDANETMRTPESALVAKIKNPSQDYDGYEFFYTYSQTTGDATQMEARLVRMLYFCLVYCRASSLRTGHIAHHL
jgi:hypothetical protein